MISYISTKAFESTRYPGVKFNLRKMSQARRIRFNELTSTTYMKLQELQSQRDVVKEEIDRAESEAALEPCQCPHSQEDHSGKGGFCTVKGCKCRHPHPDPAIGDYAKMLEIDSKIGESIVTELFPAFIRWGVSTVEGLEIDGVTATIDAFLENMPEEFISEVGREVQKMIALTPDEVMGFERPTTSGAVVGGPTSDTTAPPASELSTTKGEYAVAISPI